MVSISGDEHHVIKLSERGEFICLESEPYVNALFHNLCLTITLHLTQMLVMEYHIILNQSILKFTFIIKEMLIVCLFHTKASTEIMGFRNLAISHMDIFRVGDSRTDKIEQRPHTYNGTLLSFQGTIDLGVIAAINKNSYRQVIQHFYLAFYFLTFIIIYNVPHIRRVFTIVLKKRSP